MRFLDRADAGRQLAKRLTGLRGEHPVVLGLPRGGVPIAAAVARELGTAMDVFVARKIGAPYHPELAVGAVAEGGTILLEGSFASVRGADTDEIWHAAGATRAEILRQVRALRGDRPVTDVEGRTVILIDDGIATGWTMRAALKEMRRRGAAKVVVAAPVIDSATREDLAREADEVVCVVAPQRIVAVGLWYRDFEQLSDQEVRRWLDERPSAAGEVPA